MEEKLEPEFLWRYKACVYRTKIDGVSVFLMIYPRKDEAYGPDRIKYTEWAVTLLISRKRAVKEFSFDKLNWNKFENMQTGSGTVKGLLYAKKALTHFLTVWLPDYRKSRTEAYRDRVCVSWTDNRRRDVYRRYLSELGFTEGNIDREASSCMYVDIMKI